MTAITQLLSGEWEAESYFGGNHAQFTDRAEAEKYAASLARDVETQAG